MGSGGSKEEKAAVEWLADLVKKGGGAASLKELPLHVWRIDSARHDYTFNEHKDHVVTLWQMDRDDRAEVWKKRLGAFQSLESLKLGGVKFTECDAGDEELAALLPEGTNLQHVDTLLVNYAPKITLGGFQHLVHCGLGPQVRHIYFEELGELSDEALQVLAEAGCSVALESLFLIACPKITDAGIQHLAGGNCGKHLTELDMHRSENLSDGAVEALATQGCGLKLKHLDLTDLPTVTERGLVQLVRQGCGVNLERALLEGTAMKTTVFGVALDLPEEFRHQSYGDCVREFHKREFGRFFWEEEGEGK